MSRRLLAAAILGTALAFIAQSSFAAEPTLRQVYQAAEVGNYREAQDLMDQVLRDHPNSAKAHFVEAELLAKQGKNANAKTEFDTAERLEPGLPFSKPSAVAELRARLSVAQNGSAAGLAVERASQPTSAFPWGLVVVGLMLIAAIIFFFRRRPAPMTVIPAPSNTLGGFGPGTQPYGYGNVGPMGGGTGPNILGSLATGAALGAGMVAGESLVHRMLDGGHRSNDNYIPGNDVLADNPSQYDMGGNDFGVADSSSWDDSAGSDDWS